MAFTQQGIFPTSVYGQISDTYGTAVTQYANTNGFPGGSGLILGQGWLLYDFTIVNLLKSSGAVAANAAVTYVIGNGNIDTVATTTTANTVPIIAVNDRGGALSGSNYINWMTVRGLASALVAGSLTAPQFLVSSTSAGQLGAATAGTSLQANIYLLNTTTSAGAYPVWIA